MNEHDYSEEEKTAIEELRGGMHPSPNLETQTILRLRGKGLLKGSRHLQVYLKWVTTATAACVIFYLGSVWNKPNDHRGFSYVLLLYEGQDFQQGDSKTKFEEYGAWAKSIRKMGVEITGEKLSDEHWMVERDSVWRMNGVHHVSGYFLVNVTSMERAISIAKESPHLKYGGTIELRKIVNE